MLLVFGRGYTGRAILRAAREAGMAAAITSRSGAEGDPAVVPFDAAAAAIAAARAVIVTAPPDATGADPVLARWGEALRAAPRLRWIGYLSTTGVYGDRGGGWVDETTAPAPAQPRSLRRREVELAWTDFADRFAVDLCRVAGIYGPGRAPFQELRAGRGRRIHQPGHVFSRIHVGDIAGAVLEAARQDRAAGPRVLHLADDLPAAPAHVTGYAADLLGVARPPVTAFAEAAAGMSEMARSFWAENRRVASVLTQRALGRRWTYPTYREGLAAILAEESLEGAGEQ